MKATLAAVAIIALLTFFWPTAQRLIIDSIWSSGNQAVTMDKFSQLQEGMTYESAVAILGGPGTEISRGTIGGITTVMYEWKGSGVAGMNAMFQDGRLAIKAQFGLR